VTTFKLEIVKEFGRFKHRLTPSAETPGDWTEPVGDKQALLVDLGRSLGGVAFAKGDTVIFRSVAYTDAAELTNTVKFSNF